MRQGRGRPRKGRDARLFPTLRELGISKQLSSDCQKLAVIPEAEFERRLAAAAAMKDPQKLTMAAMLGAVAAGAERGGHTSLADAVARMAPPPSRVYRPDARHQQTYDELYRCYRELYDAFGRSSNLMQRLRGWKK